jgi:hypothetical protein
MARPSKWWAAADGRERVRPDLRQIFASRHMAENTTLNDRDQRLLRRLSNKKARLRIRAVSTISKNLVEGMTDSGISCSAGP